MLIKGLSPRQVMLDRHMVLYLTWSFDLRKQNFSLSLEVCHQALVALCAFVELLCCQCVVLVQLLLELIQS